MTLSLSPTIHPTDRISALISAFTPVEGPTTQQAIDELRIFERVQVPDFQIFFRGILVMNKSQIEQLFSNPDTKQKERLISTIDLSVQNGIISYDS